MGVFCVWGQCCFLFTTGIILGPEDPPNRHYVGRIPAQPISSAFFNRHFIGHPLYYLQAIQEHIMRWLYTLHLRAPGSTVMLVANKCDRSINEHAKIAASVEARARELLQDWQGRRGFDGRSTGRVTDVTLLAGPSCVSCLKGVRPGASGLDALIGRISPPTGTSIQGPASIQVSSIQVPPVWDMARKVIDALRSGSDPLQAVRRHLQLAPSAPSTIGGQGKMTDVFITNARLKSLWKAILKSVQDEVKAGQAASVSNSDTALEGALWIR